MDVDTGKEIFFVIISKEFFYIWGVVFKLLLFTKIGKYFKKYIYCLLKHDILIPKKK